MANYLIRIRGLLLISKIYLIFQFVNVNRKITTLFVPKEARKAAPLRAPAEALRCPVKPGMTEGQALHDKALRGINDILLFCSLISENCFYLCCVNVGQENLDQMMGKRAPEPVRRRCSLFIRFSRAGTEEDPFFRFHPTISHLLMDVKITICFCVPGTFRFAPSI